MTFISNILAVVSAFIITVISGMGYLGIVLLMAIESACIPIPSEIIMPFAGYLAFQGRFSLFFVALAGAMGNVIGSLIAYGIGYYGGRPLVLRYGKYVLVKEKELKNAEKWFKKYGPSSAFLSRLMPVIRTFISLPAGIAKADIKKFTAYTFIGSFIWSYLLAFIGFKLGEKWSSIESYFRNFDFLIVIVIILAIFLFWRKHRNKN
ncbi:DedA family protein [Candidatus Pacearchaeota archaeon]|nr:DedA family protein [Candidatus Pacearchaeota archaeon]